MIQGTFIGNTPWIEIIIGWRQISKRILAVLDTGFTGDLQITPQAANELSLEVSNTIKVQIANGQTIQAPVVTAVSEMEGETKYIQALLSNGTPLVGINFLRRFSYKAVVDCKGRKISLNRIN